MLLCQFPADDLKFPLAGGALVLGSSSASSPNTFVLLPAGSEVTAGPSDASRGWSGCAPDGTQSLGRIGVAVVLETVLKPLEAALTEGPTEDTPARWNPFSCVGCGGGGGGRSEGGGGGGGALESGGGGGGGADEGGGGGATEGGGGGAVDRKVEDVEEVLSSVVNPPLRKAGAVDTRAWVVVVFAGISGLDAAPPTVLKPPLIGWSPPTFLNPAEVALDPLASTGLNPPESPVSFDGVDKMPVLIAPPPVAPA
jgi:hypothetical protein